MEGFGLICPGVLLGRGLFQKGGNITSEVSFVVEMGKICQAFGLTWC